MSLRMKLDQQQETRMYRSKDFLASLAGKMELEPYVKQHATRFAKTIGEINRYYSDPSSRRGVRLLDCGSHSGAMTIALKTLGYDAHGVDFTGVIEEFKERYNKNQIEVRSFTDPTKLPYEDGYFDCVVFAEALEHIYENPVTILTEMKRILKVGGILVITTPNVMRLENKLKFFLNINIYQDLFRYTHNPRFTLHFREYTRRELVTLLEKYVRMQVVRATMFDSPAGRTYFRNMIQRILYAVNYLIPGFKTVLIAVAKKLPDGTA